MTREEAIDKLEWLWNEVYNEGSDGSDYAEAIDMAISVLQTNPNCDNCKEYGSYKCTKCDGEMYYKTEPRDLISRAEAIKAIHKKCDEEGLLGRYDIEWTLDEVPSVSAERIKAEKDCRNCKYGKWNDHFDNYLCYNPKNCTDWDLWETEECVSAERVGKWTRNTVYKDVIFCSECGMPFKLWDKYEIWYYCPNCGARMVSK